MLLKKALGWIDAAGFAVTTGVVFFNVVRTFLVVVIFVVILVIDELEELAPETKIVELRLNDELACNVTTTG